VLMHALAANCEELRARTGNPPLRQTILLVKRRAEALNGLIGLSAHVSRIDNPLSHIVPYFIILLCYLIKLYKYV
jgi:hypothetical protein